VNKAQRAEHQQRPLSSNYLRSVRQFKLPVPLAKVLKQREMKIKEDIKVREEQQAKSIAG